ncbi:hypothetical protein AJ88_30615 [Mesorhizobium amorphae CCBAU 01583]|nr:hypothetical protein AJ88_30615 [Mesorhizobium amorphae CCBAU 01583]
MQVLGDTHRNAVHLFERDCSIQRRNQKVVERAPAPYLSEALRQELCGYALKIARETAYIGAGTVEFLQDADSGKFYFIEVNPRIQVEHTVTEQVTGIDIVKAQIHILDGFAIGTAESGVPAQKDIRLNGHALQCRITTEDPEHNFIPDYGRITAYRGATGFGIRLDGGTAYSGAVITRFYDPLLEKVTAWAPTPAETIARMNRALREFRIRGVRPISPSSKRSSITRASPTIPTRPNSSTRRPNCSSRSSGRTARPSCSTIWPMSASTDIPRHADAPCPRPMRRHRWCPISTARSLAAASRNSMRSVRRNSRPGCVRRRGSGHRHDDAGWAPVAARHPHAHA